VIPTTADSRRSRRTAISTERTPRRVPATASDHGVLRLRGTCASRNFHFAQDDRIVMTYIYAGTNFWLFEVSVIKGSGSSDFSAAAASLFC